MQFGLFDELPTREWDFFLQPHNLSEIT